MDLQFASFAALRSPNLQGLLAPLYNLQTMNHPDFLPQYRRCAGTCSRLLLVSAENFPTRNKEPNRYPWQPSYYRLRCHQCHREYLSALNAQTKTERYAKETVRQRENRAAVKSSPGMTWVAVKQRRAEARAKLAQTLAKAARNAEFRRTMRGGRPYDPAKDPFKLMIRQRQGNFLRRRLIGARGISSGSTDADDLRAKRDYSENLAALRTKHSRQ